MEGVGRLVERGFPPIIRAVQVWGLDEDDRVYRRFADALRRIGYTWPRIKILPPLRDSHLFRAGQEYRIPNVEHRILTSAFDIRYSVFCGSESADRLQRLPTAGAVRHSAEWSRDYAGSPVCAARPAAGSATPD
jgi:hypothetical protein